MQPSQVAAHTRHAILQLDSRLKVSALLIYIASSFTRLTWRTVTRTK